MSNIDWAADVMYETLDRQYGDFRVPTDAAQALADRGLLAPDAPEPLTAANGNPVWRADQTLMVTRYPDGEISMLLNPKQEARYTLQTARTQAALLLAAANHKEAHHG